MDSNQTPPFISCVLLDKSNNLSVPHFLICKMGKIIAFHMGFVKHLVGCLAQSGHLIMEAEPSVCNSPPFIPQPLPVSWSLHASFRRGFLPPFCVSVEGARERKGREGENWGRRKEKGQSRES